MLPITDGQRVISLAGRAIIPADQGPKYNRTKSDDLSRGTSALFALDCHHRSRRAPLPPESPVPRPRAHLSSPAFLSSRKAVLGVATSPFLSALAGGMRDQPGFRPRVEQALHEHPEVPGEVLSPRPPVGPWAPVISVKLVPSDAGGDTRPRIGAGRAHRPRSSG